MVRLPNRNVFKLYDNTLEATRLVGNSKIRAIIYEEPGRCPSVHVPLGVKLEHPDAGEVVVKVECRSDECLRKYGELILTTLLAPLSDDEVEKAYLGAVVYGDLVPENLPRLVRLDWLSRVEVIGDSVYAYVNPAVEYRVAKRVTGHKLAGLVGRALYNRPYAAIAARDVSVVLAVTKGGRLAAVAVRLSNGHVSVSSDPDDVAAALKMLLEEGEYVYAPSWVGAYQKIPFYVKVPELGGPSDLERVVEHLYSFFGAPSYFSEKPAVYAGALYVAEANPEHVARVVANLDARERSVQLGDAVVHGNVVTVDDAVAETIEQLLDLAEELVERGGRVKCNIRLCSAFAPNVFYTRPEYEADVRSLLPLRRMENDELLKVLWRMLDPNTRSAVAVRREHLERLARRRMFDMRIAEDGLSNLAGYVLVLRALARG